MEQIHVIKDERLGGVLREYIGDTEQIRVSSGRFPRHSYTLKETDIVHIDGQRYRMVDRKAEVLEKVIVTKSPEIVVGTIGNCITSGEFTNFSIDIDVPNGDDPFTFIDVDEDEYRVLEPVTVEDERQGVDESQASPEVLDLLANLARRVTSLEQQLKDTQTNVERQAQELAEVKHLTDSNEADIAMLDERTFGKQVVINTSNITVNKDADINVIARELAKRIEAGGVRI